MFRQPVVGTQKDNNRQTSKQTKYNEWINKEIRKKWQTKRNKSSDVKTCTITGGPSKVALPCYGIGKVELKSGISQKRRTRTQVLENWNSDEGELELRCETQMRENQSSNKGNPYGNTRWVWPLRRVVSHQVFYNRVLGHVLHEVCLLWRERAQCSMLRPANAKFRLHNISADCSAT